MGEYTGRDWTQLEAGDLHNMIFYHRSDESGFVAKRAAKRPRLKRK